MRFVFLHVGNDSAPALLCKSILRCMPDAEIIQCTDSTSEKIPGVTEVVRFEGDTNNLMTFRLECFAGLNIEKSAIYIDTDILILDKIIPDELLGESEVALCERTFDRNNPINTKFRGMDLSEYNGKTLGEVYPIIACFTVTKSSQFWQDCKENLESLDKKFHFWYGDQEAMRNVVASKKYATAFLPESKVACLPEHATPSYSPIALHFKGAKRKPWMQDVASQLKL